MLESPTLNPPQNSGGFAGALSRILIWPGNEVGDKWKAIARVLRDRTGASFSILCSLPQDEALYARTWKELDPDIKAMGFLYRSIDDAVDSPQEVERAARNYERRYDCLMVDVLQADRHLGLAYAVGGSSFARSQLGQRATYHRSLNVAMKTLDFFEDYLESRHPDLILLEGVASLHTKCLALVARRRGIPMRLPAYRYRNLLHWATNEYFDLPWLKSVYRQTEAEADAPPIAIDGPYLMLAKEKPKQQKLLTLSGMLQSSANDVARRVYQRLIGYRTHGRYLLGDILAYRRRAYDRHRLLESKSFHSAKELGGSRYIFFPLSHEPEGSLSVLAPEFNHQAAVIDLLAKSLPADVLLVVKEHAYRAIGIAARPEGFHSWVLRLPNVRMASMHMNSIPLIEGSTAVVSVTGTAGLEAAVMGKHVVTFGRHNLYNFLPHVQVVDSIGGLRPLLGAIAEDSDPRALSIRLQNGRRFLRALEACSVDMGQENFFAPSGPVSEEKAAVLVDLLLQHLGAAEAAR